MSWLEFATCLVSALAARSVYKDAKHALLSFPVRLRWRAPVECGEGTPSATGLVECVRKQRPTNRSDARVAREQALMANRLPSVREQAGLANARAFQQRHWDAQMHRPTPAENARRYAAEGGTW